MIYLSNTSEEQQVMIPRNGLTVGEQLTLEIRNTTSLVEESMQVEESGDSGMYALLAVSLPEGVPDGEYQYRLKDGDDMVSGGLLVIGHDSEPSQYEETITYTQYEE